MEKLKKFSKWSWDNGGNIITYIGWLVSFSIPAWFGHLTEWVSAYGPIGWVVCGFAGLIAFAFVAAMWSFPREKFVAATIARNFYRVPDRVNPMDAHFLRRRIRLEDLLPPGKGFVEGKTFEQCDLIGPLNILMLSCETQSNEFNGVDHIIIDIQQVPKIQNARVFKNCRFINCKVFEVSFLITEPSYFETIARGFANWITFTPDKRSTFNIPQIEQSADA